MIFRFKAFGSGALAPAVVFFATMAGVSISKAAGEEPFLPTWKLLKGSEKTQFIAGYLYGWRDAARVTDAAIEFVKENPTEAVEGLEKIRSLYAGSETTPDVVAREIDAFFSKSENSEATFAQAITVVTKRAPSK